MKWEGIIFDWAGTTVDFGSMTPVVVFQEIFAKRGIAVTNEEIRRPMGMLKWNHIQAMLDMPRIRGEWRRRFRSEPQDWDVDTLYDDFEPMLLSLLARGTEVKPYVVDTIAELRCRGYQIGSTTGYTNIMMKSVVKAAAAQGYEADFWITPDSVSGFGRPYPYMIFRNMEHFKWQQTSRVLKVGDTVTDILEGKHAGVKTAGILVGSSVMGMSREEYDSLTEDERQTACEQARAVYEEAGADYVLHDIRDILSIAE